MLRPSLVPLNPETSTSHVEVRVRFDETDAMGIVHHGRYFGLLEIARVEWLRKRGIRYAEWASMGRHLAVVDVTCKYMQSARFDELLDIEVTLTELRAASLRFAYVVRRDGTALTEAMTRHACVDNEGRLRRLDEAMFDVLRLGEA